MGQEFLNELIRQHRDILKFIEEIDTYLRNGESDLAMLLSMLKTNQPLIMGHVRKEDERFYPELLRTAEEKRLAAVMYAGKVFCESMKDVTRKVAGFLKMYEDVEDVKNGEEGFREDLLEVITTLKKRIDSEERGLYPFYQKYCC